MELLVDGAPARWSHIDDVLVIEVGTRGANARIRLVGESSPRSQLSTLLAEWSPVATGLAEDVDLRVFVEGSLYRVVAGVALEPTPAPPGWRGVRARGRFPVPNLLVALDHDGLPAREIRTGVATLDLDPSVLTDHLAACAERLPSIAARLLDLGPIPVQRVVALGVDGVDTSHHDGSLVLMNRQHLGALCRATPPPIDLVRIFLHELAHSWFGSVVLSHDDEAAAIWESLSEYVAFASLSPDDAAQIRRERLREYQQLDDEDAISQRVLRPQQHRWILSYDKGALTLQAIADHIGPDRFLDVLRRYIDLNRGALGSWPALIRAIDGVAGPGAASWCRTWITTPGAPTLELHGAARGGRLHGTIVQTAGTSFSGLIDVVIARADGTQVVHRLPFGPGDTPFALPLPRDATSALLDPNARLPRRVAPNTPVIPALALTASSTGR